VSRVSVVFLFFVSITFGAARWTLGPTAAAPSMEYFNFDDASTGIPPLALDDYSSLAAEANEQEANDCFESLFFEKSNNLPVDKRAVSTPTKLKLINNVEIEVVPHSTDMSADYPMYRAKVPCDLCTKMGLDCFLASRGTLITGCTCCISLYRECSFVHPKIPRGFVSTFPGISEDMQVCEGGLTERRKAIKSMEEARGRKTGARFPRDAVKILKQWLAEHADHPYPNERVKDELTLLTGLKKGQITNWLANARRRGKVRLASGPSSPMLGAIDIPAAARGDNSSMADLNPLDRWKASPPENEPASMTAIARAVTATPLLGRNSSQSSVHGSRTSSRKASSEDESAFSMFRAPSVSSFGTRDSTNSDLTFASSRSNRSKGSFASSQDRRRRRRAPMTQRVAAQQAKSRSARIFQCTFCTDSFPAKYDWQRHEKSLHLALERWTCCPGGGTFTDSLTGRPHCVFCSEVDPSAEHLEMHNFTSCQEKTLQERTFYRKDHLRQHLKLMHNAKFESSMEAWKSTTNEIKSACGFCPSKFTTWQQRADHLAAHFRNGADMSQWANGWGFEPYVEKLVENAIPPYLIGHEKMTMEPYVARAQATPSSGTDAGLTLGTSADSSEPDQMTKDSNCWARLDQELTKFVLQQRSAGRVLSDKELQDAARMIIYEDEDPWNSTCADNKQWLDTFKYQNGIGDVTDAMQTKVLAEVPIMAPYVVKGGLKNKAVEARRSVDSDGHCPAIPGCGGFLNSSAAPAPEHGMDLDFDSIDFSTLDLGMMEDDINFAVGVEGPGMRGGSNMADVDQYGSVQSGGIFGSYDVPVAVPHKQPEDFMTEQEMNQLTGYTAAFN